MIDPKEASAVKRIAGNIAGCLVSQDGIRSNEEIRRITVDSIDLAEAINDEVNRRAAVSPKGASE